LTHSHAEQLGDKLKELQSAGYVEIFGLDKEHTPNKIDITRWYTPAHWGADEATLKARKKVWNCYLTKYTLRIQYHNLWTNYPEYIC